MIIIIILKLNSGIDPRQGSGYESRGSTRLTQIIFTNNLNNLILTKFIFQKSQRVFLLKFWILRFKVIANPSANIPISSVNE